MAKSGFCLNTLLNEQSIGGNYQQEKNGAWFEIRQIPLDKIVPSPKNEYGMRDIEKLAASILTMGLMHNIVVRETDETDIYEIISGERRYRAFRMLFDQGQNAFSEIPCKVEVKITDILAEFFLLQTSATAREHTDYELAYQGMRIKEVLSELKSSGQLKELQAKGLIAKGRIREAIADMLDVSRTQVARWESIFTKLSKDFLQEFKNNKIGISMAYDISVLEQEAQETALKAYSEGGQDAIRDVLAKPISHLEPNLPPRQIEDVLGGDEPGGFFPPSTRINVEKQNRQQEPISDDHPLSPAKPLIGTDAQYQTLVGLGIEAKLNLSYATKLANKTKYAGRLEAFGMVAEEFGFGRMAYLDDVEKLLLIEGKSLAK